MIKEKIFFGDGRWYLTLLTGIVGTLLLGFVGLLLYSILYARLRYTSFHKRRTESKKARIKINFSFAVLVLLPIAMYFASFAMNQDTLRVLVKTVAAWSFLPDTIALHFLPISEVLFKDKNASSMSLNMRQFALFVAILVLQFSFILTSFYLRHLDARGAKFSFLFITSAKTGHFSGPKAALDSYKFSWAFVSTGFCLMVYVYGDLAAIEIANFGQILQVWLGFFLLIIGLWMSQFAISIEKEIYGGFQL